jgi:hypothetical protein
VAYGAEGFPLEQASKIGHIKMIDNALIKRVLEDFEDVSPSASGPTVTSTGSVDLSKESPIRHIITVDGGQAVVPNPVRREKAMAFVQVAACMLRMDDLRYMSEHPLMDPRDVNRMIEGEVWYNPAAIPLAGVHHPGLTVQQTIRYIVDRTLGETGLYETLKFLVYREWEDEWTIPPEERPHLSCVRCGREFYLPRHRLSFECSHCDNRHTLSDYLAIGTLGPEDWSREESASALRDTLETLALFHFIRKYRREDKVMAETLFVKDGPLLLRAALSRLVVPIRDLIAHIRDNEQPLYLVGVEKTGDFAGFLEEFKQAIPEPGDYFLPSVRFVVEEISGTVMTSGYRNRVSYGAKVGVRIGPDHILALNVPTGGFLIEPRPEDLIGFEESVRPLSELESYRYPNALIPLVLANSAASIARKPSGDILSTFADQLIGTKTSSRL